MSSTLPLCELVSKFLGFCILKKQINRHLLKGLSRGLMQVDSVSRVSFCNKDKKCPLRNSLYERSHFCSKTLCDSGTDFVQRLGNILRTHSVVFLYDSMSVRHEQNTEATPSYGVSNSPAPVIFVLPQL